MDILQSEVFSIGQNKSFFVVIIFVCKWKLFGELSGYAAFRNKKLYSDMNINNWIYHSAAYRRQYVYKYNLSIRGSKSEIFSFFMCVRTIYAMHVRKYSVMTSTPFLELGMVQK